MDHFSHLMIEMEIHLNPTIMKRGLAYYRSNRIVDVEIFPSHVHGIVNGKGDEYETIVYFDRFERSICTCPFTGYCKHIAALVFTLQDFGIDERTSISSTMKELSNRSKEELIHLIQDLAVTNPQAHQALLKHNKKE
ncbi:hypothetical protein HF072_14975 [Bacillus sp. RO3]|nr:hypothetical protein [Bacillus sp. RO3]